jgi:hypothetical protein
VRGRTWAEAGRAKNVRREKMVKMVKNEKKEKREKKGKNWEFGEREDLGFMAYGLELTAL